MFNKILIKMAQELNYEDAKSNLLDSLTALYRELFEDTSLTEHGTHKELRNYFKSKKIAKLDEVGMRLNTLINEANNVSSVEDLKRLAHISFPEFIKYIVTFKSEESKAEIARQAAIVLFEQKTKDAMLKAMVISDQIAHDMMIWFLAQIETAYEDLLKFFNQSYEKLSVEYKKNPINKVEDGILKNPLQKYLGFIRKYGPKVGLGYVGSEEGDLSLGSKQLEFLLINHEDLFLRLKAFMSFVMGGIKEADKLNKVREQAESINQRLVKLEIPYELKFSQPVGVFNYTENDLEIRTEDVRQMDEVFFRQLKDIIERKSPMSLEEMKKFDYKTKIQRSDLKEDLKSKFIQMFDAINKKTVPLLKQQKAMDQKYDRNIAKALIVKTDVLSDSFKEVCKELYSEFEKTIFPVLEQNLKEAIKRELGLIK